MIEDPVLPVGTGPGVHLPASADAPATAREFVRRAADRWRLPARVREVAVLVASELVTNALQHAGAPSRLTLRRDRGWLVVAVHDPDPTPPTRASVAERTAPEQALHGLDVVAALAVDWGVDAGRDGADPADGPGKTVWARLAVTRR